MNNKIEQKELIKEVLHDMNYGADFIHDNIPIKHTIFVFTTEEEYVCYFPRDENESITIH